MIHIIWEFHVRAGQEAEFEKHYAGEGTWARFFRRDPAYRGTRLVRDSSQPRRYVIIDAWDDEASYGAFRVTNRAEYTAIDEQMKPLMESEKRLGVFEVVGK